MILGAKDMNSNAWLNAVILPRATILKKPLKGLIEGLQSQGIQTRPLWELNHRQLPYLACESYQISRSKDLIDRVLTLPSSPTLVQEDVERVVSALEICLNS